MPRSGRHGRLGYSCSQAGWPSMDTRSQGRYRHWPPFQSGRNTAGTRCGPSASAGGKRRVGLDVPRLRRHRGLPVAATLEPEAVLGGGIEPCRRGHGEERMWPDDADVPPLAPELAAPEFWRGQVGFEQQTVGRDRDSHVSPRRAFREQGRSRPRTCADR
jgi:hypothetical protein